VQTNSEKLRDRGRRIVSTVTGLDDREAEALLRRAKGSVQIAIVMEKSGVNYVRARAQLRAANDSVRVAIGEA
jgi:N-acetylmuramic acid 6-phosphate (MurNAc-6-P) etherase